MERDQTLAEVVAILAAEEGPLSRCTGSGRWECPIPSREAAIRITEGLRSVFFPGYFGSSRPRPESLRYYIGHVLDDVRRELAQQIEICLRFAGRDSPEDTAVGPESACELAAEFVRRLPKIRRMLGGDVEAAHEGDPAARSLDEPILCYPGILGITNYRIAHELYQLGVPLIPRIITEHAHSITGIDIHPGAQIGERFFTDHGTGVVIGETAILGDRVRIYQGVTLGAKRFPTDADGNPVKGIPRHPIIEDDVTIYSGATILGRVTIGRGSTIGGNVWLTRSVPPDSRITLYPPRREVFDEGGGI